MNLTRLMVLGTLARHGPRHGHEIRRIAEVTNVGEWGGVSVGALYRELRAITGEGQLELGMLREQAIRSIHWWPDPLGVALSFASAGTDREELASWLRSRRETFALIMARLEEDRQRMVARGWL